MISVLIPIYNYDIRPLVNDLIQQAESCRTEIEIICMDDASTLYRDDNATLNHHEIVAYIALGTNIGRSAIRNRLATLAKGEQLIFIDCDSGTESPNYLSNYVQHAGPNHLVYGGRTYSKKRPDAKHLFRWTYGNAREVLTAAEREDDPYRSFMTNNFMIPKAIFDQIKFDESLTQYGHEDTLFGLELRKRNIPIVHINNPLTHLGLETNEEFLQKTRLGVQNLLQLFNDNKISDQVKLLKAFKLAKTTRTMKTLAKRFEKKQLEWETQLCSDTPDMKVFDLYKLSYMCKLQMDQDSNN